MPRRERRRRIAELLAFFFAGIFAVRRSSQ